MTFIGLDISKRRIGIAIGDFSENHRIILPLKIIEPKDFEKFIMKMKKNKEKNIFIIGLPGNKYENFKNVKHFSHKYRHILKPFYFQNEDFTTRLIETETNKKKPNDDFAACVILDLFFKNKTFEEICKLFTENDE